MNIAPYEHCNLGDAGLDLNHSASGAGSSCTATFPPAYLNESWFGSVSGAEENPTSVTGADETWFRFAVGVL